MIMENFGDMHVVMYILDTFGDPDVSSGSLGNQSRKPAPLGLSSRDPIRGRGKGLKGGFKRGLSLFLRFAQDFRRTLPALALVIGRPGRQSRSAVSTLREKNIENP